MLKRQLNAETKRTRYVFYTIIFLSMLYIITNLVFGEAGYLKYRHLKEGRTGLEAEIGELKAENKKLAGSLESYRMNDFYKEKHAREDFGMAGSDEYIFVYEK